jgi:hypothetical protein
MHFGSALAGVSLLLVVLDCTAKSTTEVGSNHGRARGATAMAVIALDSPQ